MEINKEIEELKQARDTFAELAQRRLEEIQKMKENNINNFNLYAKECVHNEKLRKDLKEKLNQIYEIIKPREDKPNRVFIEKAVNLSKGGSVRDIIPKEERL